MIPRETPLSLIQLKNMVSVTEAGAVVLPACPAFYSRPQNLDDLIDVLATGLGELGMHLAHSFRRGGIPPMHHLLRRLLDGLDPASSLDQVVGVADDLLLQRLWHVDARREA